ncbi:methyltransferase MtaB domain-containing protein [Desulfosporosinus lacus]|uniref:Methanol:corrinoid methyltransferase n=1 Tax=Desulfosporosinus lacus DSM 15449 TaxID=1121420 RepID=A0A1M5YQD2_9FIRM|nr:methyltransferase MtaB domain-containing protein [Desulfosporosinus lacus]SHI14171.1 methanol:corrinoid methyltransferase [Desulfosporosinus lacus DSM 15449]
MASLQFNELAYTNLDEFIYGHAKKPVVCSNGMVIGGGTVYPEVNLTLPTMLINTETMPKVLSQYEEMIHGICSKAHELLSPGIIIEIELLPPCTFNPQWGIDVTKVVKGVMNEYYSKFGLKSLLRMTVVDIREGKTLTHMYKGEHWDNVIKTFRGCAEAGADFLAIESIGGKHLHDEAVMNCDLPRALFSLGVVGCRDMVALWDEIVKISTETNCIPSGDTACGFANTSMVMAHKNFIPKVFAAIDRVMCAVRTLVAVERGALGPDKDCGYEGVYLKAITGIPISMEGRTAACAHSSSVGNIAACLADCWSNESVENVRLLGGMAPTVYTEHLIYDCRIMNVASARGFALEMRDILSESDRMYDPQAYILDPGVVIKISQEIVKGKTHFERTKIAASATIKELRSAFQDGLLQLDTKELKYLDIFEKQLKLIPNDEAEFTQFMIKNSTLDKFDPAKYDFNFDVVAK